MHRQPPAVPPIHTTSFALRPRRAALLIGLAILTLVILIALAGGRDVVTAMTNVKLGWIGLAVLIHYSGFAVRGMRWQQLLRVMGHKLSWRYSTALLLSGWFVSALLPARAGDLLRVTLLRLDHREHAPVAIADSFGSIVLERILDLIALLLLGATVGGIVLQGQLPNWVLMAYGVAVAALTAIGAGLLLLPVWLKRLERWSQHTLWQTLLQFAHGVVTSLRTLATHPMMTVLVLIESIYIWLCDALLMWLVLKAMGVAATFGAIAFVALTVDIFAAVPVTPGGIGQIEAVNAALFALLPLPPFNIAAAVLINRAISYWSFLLFSGIVTFAAGIGQLVMQTRRTEKQ
ncbi:MAG: lysylphosphatidylglycerol synthase transmembrane domain-containing protein [Caldilineaceae bacterium]